TSAKYSIGQETLRVRKGQYRHPISNPDNSPSTRNSVLMRVLKRRRLYPIKTAMEIQVLFFTLGNNLAINRVKKRPYNPKIAPEKKLKLVTTDAFHHRWTKLVMNPQQI